MVDKSEYDKMELLGRLLDGCDYCSFDVCNTHITDGPTGGHRICLLSGLPEDDRVLAAIREAVDKCLSQ